MMKKKKCLDNNRTQNLPVNNNLSYHLIIKILIYSKGLSFPVMPVCLCEQDVI